MFFAGSLQTLLVVDLVDQNERWLRCLTRQLGVGAGGGQEHADVARHTSTPLELVGLDDGHLAGGDTPTQEATHQDVESRHRERPLVLREGFTVQPLATAVRLSEPEADRLAPFHGVQNRDYPVSRRWKSANRTLHFDLPVGKVVLINNI